jgi:hypothetical protein
MSAYVGSGLPVFRWWETDVHVAPVIRLSNDNPVPVCGPEWSGAWLPEGCLMMGQDVFLCGSGLCPWVVVMQGKVNWFELSWTQKLSVGLGNKTRAASWSTGSLEHSFINWPVANLAAPAVFGVRSDSVFVWVEPKSPPEQAWTLMPVSQGGGRTGSSCTVALELLPN